MISKEDILKRWVTFYKDLYSDTNTCNSVSISDTELQIPTVTSDFLLKKMKSGQSSGIDLIHTKNVEKQW